MAEEPKSPISQFLGPGIQAGVGLIQGIIGGIGMARQAKREPKYEIPKEVGEAVSLARGMAAEGMPAAQRVAAQQDIQQSALMGMRAAQDRRGGLASISNIQAGMDRSALGLAAQDAAIRQQNQRFKYTALMAGASYADKAFANRWQANANKMQMFRSLAGAGIANVTGAATSLSTRSLYDSIYGTGDGGGGTDGGGTDGGGNLSRIGIGARPDYFLSSGVSGFKMNN